MGKKNDYKWVVVEDPKLKKFTREELEKIFNEKLARIIIHMESCKDYENVFMEDSNKTKVGIKDE